MVPQSLKNFSQREFNSKNEDNLDKYSPLVLNFLKYSLISFFSKHPLVRIDKERVKRRSLELLDNANQWGSSLVSLF
jgi:hypothetical protein